MKEKNIIIFDVDGTLTETNRIDSELFYQTIKDNLKLTELSTEWENYRYSTDSGFLLEIFEHNFQRVPTEDELTNIRNDFVICLQNFFSQDESHCPPIPGATEIFSFIQELGGWHIAIATGCWERSALLKLNTAKIPHISIPKAFSEDHLLRSEIIKTAIDRSKNMHQTEEYSRIIYVGDRVWDKAATEELQIEFIGIGANFFGKIENAVENYTGNNLNKFKSLIS